MASIVKELDKVTGTTTRSHNIADAVSKLKMGGGSDGSVCRINLITEDVEENGELVPRRSMDKTFVEIQEMYQSGILPYLRIGGGYIYTLYAIDSDSISFASIPSIYVETDGDDNSYLVISSCTYILNSNDTVEINSNAHDVALYNA